MKDIVEHFAAFPDVPDPLAYLGGRQKAPYRFIVRQPSIRDKVNQFERKTTNFEIQKVSSENCCDHNCCQLFPRDTPEIEGCSECRLGIRVLRRRDR